MKSEKGITLTSLIIYVIVMLIVISVIALITTYFYNNVNKIGEKTDPAKEYTKFNSYFTEEVNKKGCKVIECKKSSDLKNNYIIFDGGIQYTYIFDEENQKGNVYKDNVKICENIFDMYFENKIIDEAEGKEQIIVHYKTEKNTLDKTTKFTLVN